MDKSRVDQVTELMEKLTPKTKDFLVNARIKEKEEEKTSNSPLKFAAAVGGTPMTVAGQCVHSVRVAKEIAILLFTFSIRFSWVLTQKIGIENEIFAIFKGPEGIVSN